MSFVKDFPGRKGMKSRYTKLSLFSLALLLAGCHHPPDQWKCTATDTEQLHYINYAPTQVEAASLVRHRCQLGKFRPTCYVRCIPPRSRWHCVAIDKKGNTWYWNSTKRSVAVKNAIAACRKNSTLGGCKVPTKNCSMT